MKKLIVVAWIAIALAAQETRREETLRSSNPVDDTKALSASVPDVYAIRAQLDRVVVLRFKFDTDLLAGLEKMVKQEKIKNAVILSAFGSVRGYQVHQVSNRDFPTKNMFVTDPTKPADIIGMGGFVMGGKVHPHITLAVPERSFGGHLEPGTKVFTFAVVTLGILPDSIDFGKLDDKNYR
jgi:predicted DNA-binding protein with PD1-like motif